MIHHFQQDGKEIEIDDSCNPPTLTMIGVEYRDLDNYPTNDQISFDLTEDMANDLSLTLGIIANRLTARRIAAPKEDKK